MGKQLTVSACLPDTCTDPWVACSSSTGVVTRGRRGSDDCRNAPPSAADALPGPQLMSSSASSRSAAHRAGLAPAQAGSPWDIRHRMWLDDAEQLECLALACYTGLHAGVGRVMHGAGGQRADRKTTSTRF